MKIDKRKYFNFLEKELFKKKYKDVLDDKLRDVAPDCAGVYAVFKNDKLIYIGESGNVKKRVCSDMRQTYNHALRKYIGRELCGKDKEFVDASSSKKFPDLIEEKVNEYLKKCTVSFLPIELGRVEFEEAMVEKHKPKFNVKKKRKIVYGTF